MWYSHLTRVAFSKDLIGCNSGSPRYCTLMLEHLRTPWISWVRKRREKEGVALVVVTFTKVVGKGTGLMMVMLSSSSFCKNGGGRPGIFYHVNDVNVYLGRWGRGEGSPIERMHFTHAVSISNLERYIFRFTNV